MFNAPTEIIDGDLLIRTYRSGDAAALCEATNSSYDHLKRFLPWATAHQTMDETEALVAAFEARYASAEDFVLSIWRIGVGQPLLLGGCGFHLREGALAGGCAEIGMWIRAGQAGQGVGRRVLGLLLRWGFADWPWQRLAWRCNTLNVASIRCAEANHMVREGTLRGQYDEITGGRRDTACYGMLREEWHAKNRLNSTR